MRRFVFQLCTLLILSVGSWTQTGVAQEAHWEEGTNAGPQGEAVGPTEAAESFDETDALEQKRALEQFEPELSPYGSWVVDERYGRVWVPRVTVVGAGFVPYQSGGHWTLTTRGDWLWVSDYPFGWVAFHYGRWARLSHGPWGWIPGYRYSPAWVNFRVGARGYVGWGPRPPRRRWRHGAYWALSGPSVVHFVFCPSSYVFAAMLHPHLLRDPVRIRRLSRTSRRYRVRRSVRGRRVYGPTLAVAGVARAAAPRRRVSLSNQRRRRSGSYTSGSRVRKPARHKSARQGSARHKSKRRAKTKSREARRHTTRSASRSASKKRVQKAKKRSKRQKPRAKKSRSKSRSRRANPSRSRTKSRRAPTKKGGQPSKRGSSKRRR